jgi:hypothetical protein
MASRTPTRGRSASLTLLLAGLALLPGCGGPTMGRVEGRVTCNGVPVANAVIIFSPVPASADDREPGKAASASTDAQGKFVLTTYRAGDGALVGSHRVAVTLDPQTPCACPSKVFTREVQKGNNEVSLELNE